MEELLSYINKVEISDELLKQCKIQLIFIDDIKTLKENKEDFQLKLKISIEYDILYDRLYTGKWSDVAEELRQMFLILSFLKAYLIIKSTTNEDISELIEAIRILDVGIMIGFGLDDCEWLTDFTQKLHDFVISLQEIPTINSIAIQKSLINECDIDKIDQPSIEHFCTKYFYLHRPVVLTNTFNHWPAMTKWKDLNYLMKIGAYRTVPIELGRSYDDDNWGQNMFKFGDFIKEFMIDEEEKVTKAYLAQHDLFDQIPLLKKDFYTPDYCAISSHDPVIKSWIGPKGTISTMHTDDKSNLLCQVMGEKLIILASPSETMNLYPYEGMLNNTTQIDAENLDLEKFPLVKNVKFHRIVLKAGEVLFIPRLWWHYVRSLTPSISISFWFDDE